MRANFLLLLFALGSACGVPDVSLSALSVSPGALGPDFASDTTMYTVTVPLLVNVVQVTATAADPSATIQIDGMQAVSGSASAPITVGSGPTPITVLVQAGGGAQKSYEVLLVRTPIDYLKASNTGALDRFGVNVSLSGDTLAVGAPGEASSGTGVNSNTQNDNSAVNSGAVYVFTRSGTQWSQQAYIKASNTGAGDFFGSSVSLSGDTLAVGAYGESSSGTGVNSNSQGDNSTLEAGAVYVFARSGTQWSQQAYIKASNTGAGDQFGSSVSLSSDTLAVGAPYESSNGTGVNSNSQNNNGASQSGAVYVFTRSGTQWSQQAYVKASNTDAGDEFGVSVSLSSDTLAVGAINEASSGTGVSSNTQNDNSAAASGAVYVFTRSGTQWSQQAYLKASNTDAGDQFGFSVSLSSDTLAVGANLESSNGNTQADNSAVNSGAVYVFTRSGTQWSQQGYLKASNTGFIDYFGYSVSLSADTLAVGANREFSNGTGVDSDTQKNNSARETGAVYVFTRSGTQWSQQAYLKASNSGAGDQFGSSLSLSSDALAVAAPYEASSGTGVNSDTQNDNSAMQSGAVYVYRQD